MGVRRRAAVLGIAALMVGAALSNLLSPPTTVPPLLALVVPFIAAAFLSVRATAVVAALAVVESYLLGAYSDDYTGWSLYSRVLLTIVAGVIAVGLARIRAGHESEIVQARADLAVSWLLQAVVDSARDPIYAKDSSGRYLAANNAAAATLGVDSGSMLIGRRDRDFVDPARAARIEADDLRTLESGGRLEFEEELEVPERRILLTHKTVLRDVQGRSIGLSGIAKDVSVKRQAQRELESSERRFRSLVEATSSIVWQADEHGEFVTPQDRWEDYTGQGWHEHRGLGWLEAVHPDDRDRMTQEWLASLTARSFHESAVRLWQARRGDHRHVVLRAVPIVDAAGHVSEWLGTCEDVHERHVAEQRLRRIAEARDLVAEVASRVMVASGVDAVLHGTLGVLEERLPAHVGSITLRDDEPRPKSVTAAASGTGAWDGWRSLPSDGRLPSREVAVTGVGLEFADVGALTAAYPDTVPLVERLGLTGPTFVVPLDTGARVMGALQVTFREPVDAGTVELGGLALAGLAPVVAHGLLQAEFHEREAEIASSFQRSMLELALEADPRVALSVHYQAGAEQLEAGGDWYDVVPLADGRLALMVGDVVGRSLRAATVMGRLRGACRGLLLATGDPAVVLAHLDTVAATIDGARFATCCCVVLDPAAQTATYSSAGHPPALLLPAGDDARFLWDAQGPPLAVRGTVARTSATVDFPICARMFLYTDGLVERHDEVLDKGLDRLAAAAAAGRSSAIEGECNRIAEELFDDFSQNDDVALVAVELVSYAADEIQRQIGPDPAMLHRVRRDLRVWLTGHRLDDARVGDIVLAVAEGLSNAVEHANAPPDGVTLNVERIGEHHGVRATIADSGHWRPPTLDPTRGRGLTIMHAVADRVEVDSGEHGTTVTLEFD